MIRGFFLLLFFPLVGEILERALSAPAPGRVIGLALPAVALWRYNRWRLFTARGSAGAAVGIDAVAAPAKVPFIMPRLAI